MASYIQSRDTRKKIENYSYNLTSNIGKGYSSIVYKGKNDLTSIKYHIQIKMLLLKVIDMKMIKGDVHKNLLNSEIDILKSLKHSSNIIDLFDIYTTKNNNQYHNRALLIRRSSKMYQQQKIILQSQAIQLMNQIINGYNNLSRNGIIHRDLKPANIFLNNKQVKIADFGFAMKTSDSKKYSSYNVGSPIYMPPEALNDNKYSFKSDIWALGVIFYEMLTGKTPWKAKTQKQLGKQLLAIPIQKVMPKNISQSSTEFLRKTLAVNLNDRMNPQELNIFSFFSDKFDKQSTRADLVSTNSIFEARNNLLKSNNRTDTSLNRNTVNTPKNFNRLNFIKNAANSVSDLKENKNTSLPKQTLQTAKTKTEFLISATSNQNLTSGFNSTQKSFSNFRSTNNITIIDKKLVSKHLLSQIHFCRFVYKMLMRIESKLSFEFNHRFNEVKQMMSGILFEKLQNIQELKQLNSIQKKQYRQTADYLKIVQIVHQYQVKYQKDLKSIAKLNANCQQLRYSLDPQIIYLYNLINSKSISEVKQQVIVLDYLITLRQLLIILEEDNIQNFHNKAKIQQIVQGAPSQNITSEHVSAITQKLKTLKIL